MSPLAHAVTTALFAFVWQGAAVGLGLSIVLALLSRRSANLRYLACSAAMALLAALPLGTAWMAYSNPASFINSLPGMAPNLGAGLLAALQPWAIPVWSIGVALSSLRFLAGWWHVSQLRGSVMQVSAETMKQLAAIEGRLELAGRARVAIAALADGPVVVGLWRPMILLPLSAAIELTRDQLEAVLAHEAAHVRRYDYAVNVIQAAVETVLFYHPVIWWVSARMRREREQCCDEAAVAMSGDPVVYARGLLTLERLRLSTPTLAVGATGAGGELSARIARLLGRTSSTSVWPATAIALVAFVLIACGGSLLDPKGDEARPATEELSQVLLDHPAGAVDASLELRENSPTVGGRLSQVRLDNPAGAVDATLELRETAPAVGRRLARIQLDSKAAKSGLRLNLPVKLGDPITSTTQAQVEKALVQLDGHLGADLFAIPGGQAALVITLDSVKQEK